VAAEEGEEGNSAGLTNYSQNDEDEMGMTYEELDTFGYVSVWFTSMFLILSLIFDNSSRLRKEKRCGPLSMFRTLVGTWTWLDVAVVAEKVGPNYPTTLFTHFYLGI
jgi:hypothetical protein